MPTWRQLQMRHPLRQDLFLSIDLGMKMRGMIKIKNKAITVISIMLPILGMKISMDSKTVLNNIPKTLMNLNLKVKMLLKMEVKGLIVTDPRNARSVEQSMVPKGKPLFPRMRMKTWMRMKTQMKMILKRPLKGSIDTNLENRLAPSNTRLIGRRVIKVKVLKVKAPKGKAPSTKEPKVNITAAPVTTIPPQLIIQRCSVSRGQPGVRVRLKRTGDPSE